MRRFFKAIFLRIKLIFFKFKLKRIKQLNMKPMENVKPHVMGATSIVPSGTVINVDGGKSVLDVDLISDKLSHDEKKKLRQTTKTFMWTLVVASLIWISWSYVLATISLILLQNPEPLSELSKEVCTVILGSVIGYMCKSFVETFAQKTSEMLERHWHENNQNNYISTELNSQNNDFMEE
jgi:hypothetical protein